MSLSFWVAISFRFIDDLDRPVSGSPVRYNFPGMMTIYFARLLVIYILHMEL